MPIRWTEPAANDLTNICDYLKEHASSGIARRAALVLFQRVSTLEDFPDKGRLGRAYGTRELVFSTLPYIVVYRIQEETVEVLRIIHSSRDWL